MSKVAVKSFFDIETATFSYIVSDPSTKKCAVIDPVLNFDLASGKTSTTAIELLIEYIRRQELTLDWILETHAHADHLTGAHVLKERLGGKIGIGANITEVLGLGLKLFNDTAIAQDGSQFDVLFKEGHSFNIGSVEVKVLHTPGHTPACICYLIEDAIFVGDTIFMPHLGTARTDFPGGSAEQLYDSIQKILSLANQTRIFVGHDYPAKGIEPSAVTTVEAQKAQNIMINQSISKADFIAKRNQRDASLAVPKLLLPALQVNLRAGQLPKPQSNQVSYLKIPLNQFVQET